MAYFFAFCIDHCFHFILLLVNEGSQENQMKTDNVFMIVLSSNSKPMAPLLAKQSEINNRLNVLEHMHIKYNIISTIFCDLEASQC